MPPLNPIVGLNAAAGLPKVKAKKAVVLPCGHCGGTHPSPGTFICLGCGTILCVGESGGPFCLPDIILSHTRNLKNYLGGEDRLILCGPAIRVSVPSQSRIKLRKMK